MNKQLDSISRQRHWQKLLRACCLLLVASTAQAQLALPALPLPATPNPRLPVGAVHGAVNELTQLDSIIVDAASEVNSQSQNLLRAARVQKLLREHRDTLEADANGAPVLRSQVLLLSPSSQSLRIATAAGFIAVQDQTMDGLDLRVMTLQAPAGMSARRALQRLRRLDPTGNYDYNHVYTQSAAATVPAASAGEARPRSFPNTRVGLIDSGVEVTHQVFRNNHVYTWGCDQQVMPSMHGTAVASLLVGQSEHFNGAAPGAMLYVADVYCGQAVGGAMTRIAGALGWLAQQQVPVINISLVGPDNALLKQSVAHLITRGYLIVAAVGNDGPAAPPLYPAAYPDVIGVTGVDAQGRVLVEAGRGKQVILAAPGSDMAAATLQDKFINVRGTSFAAPLVAGLLAIHLDAPQLQAANAARTELLNSARDVGAKGVDTTYGYGIVGEALRMTMPAASN